MATELGKAYVQIVPSAKGISGSISKELAGEATSAGKSAGFNIAGAIKTALVSAGIGTALKSALDAGGALQQSYGGLETIYGDAAEAAKKYAAEAVTAGISANSYAEQAVSFGASLKQAFSGDTKKAMEAANVAILDMADNSAKMGTDISAVQNAYQGFAKQNYTMLDNLKLGYGGTKTEMERLLKDAEKLSGVKYDISNLGDVYSAIHVIQKDLGLTGVAAAEAEGTFTGSMASMKAATQNLLANLALGEDIKPSLEVLEKSVYGFLINNMLPMIGNVLKAVPKLVEGLSTILLSGLNMASQHAGEVVKIGVDVVTGLVKAIVGALPYLVEAAFKIVKALGESIINTDWAKIGQDLLGALRDSIDLAADEIFGGDMAAIDAFIGSLLDGVGALIDTGVELLLSLIDGISSALPNLLSIAGDMLLSIVSGLLDHLPDLLTAAVEIIMALVNGLSNNIGKIVDVAGQIFAKLVSTILSHLPEILATGITLIGKLAAGILQALPQIVKAIPQIIDAIINAFKNVDWQSVGRNIIEGIKNGILNAISLVVDAARNAASSAYDAVKSFWGIASPAKKGIYLGSMFDAGILEGVEDNADEITKATNSMVDNAFNQIALPQPTFNVAPQSRGANGNLTLNMTINGAEGQDINALADIIQSRINMAVQRKELVYA